MDSEPRLGKLGFSLPGFLASLAIFFVNSVLSSKRIPRQTLRRLRARPPPEPVIYR